MIPLTSFICIMDVLFYDLLHRMGHVRFSRFERCTYITFKHDLYIIPMISTQNLNSFHFYSTGSPCQDHHVW
jgi:hypothetical protein